jgi:SAM-dependent methyltransferase
MTHANEPPKGVGSVSEVWKENLREAGYEAPDVSAANCAKVLRLRRSWRRIFGATGMLVGRPARVLEFGCGGGHQLMPLYVRGWDCTGVDVSPEVIERARTFARGVDTHCSPKGRLRLICLEFKDYLPEGGLFDLTFQFGVLEHFLDDSERFAYLKKMFDLTRPGGWVVSMVPCGLHPLRAEQRALGLGGYKIPEIDYSPALLADEMQRCGATSIRVLAHDPLGYVNLKPRAGVLRLVKRAAYYAAQIPLFRLLPLEWLSRHSYSLIAAGRKGA